MDNECTKLEVAEVYIPDEYKFDCDGHAVDVCASTYCTNKIELHFWTPERDCSITSSNILSEGHPQRVLFFFCAYFTAHIIDH